MTAELQAALTALGIPFTNVDPNAGTPSPALFNTAIYSAIIVASDQSCNGCDNDTTSSTNLANAAASFASFYNSGGGIVGLAGADNLGYYKFVPVPVVQHGPQPNLVTGYVQTAFGAEIGVPAVNGDATHNFFSRPGTGGVNAAYGVVEILSGTSNGGVDEAITIAIQCGRPSQVSFLVNYFAGADGSRPDQTVRIINPGTSTSGVGSSAVTNDLCANIYVFRADQQLTECCSCLVTPDGLRTLSVDFDLTHNSLTAGAIGEGVIKIVDSAVPGSGCGPSVAASGYAPIGTLKAWGTHNQDVSGGLSGSGVINEVTETHFLPATLSNAELNSLQSNCRFIAQQGSKAGLCTCGRGD